MTNEYPSCDIIRIGDRNVQFPLVANGGVVYIPVWVLVVFVIVCWWIFSSRASRTEFRELADRFDEEAEKHDQLQTEVDNLRGELDALRTEFEPAEQPRNSGLTWIRFEMI
jgi:hypothetical protein